MLDISVLRKELEKTGYLDEKVKGFYDCYLFKKPHTYFIIVNHILTQQNYLSVIDQISMDLCPDKPTGRDFLFGGRQYIIMARTSEIKRAWRKYLLFGRDCFPAIRAKNHQPYVPIVYAFYLINEESGEIIRDLWTMPWFMPKRIKAINHAVGHYLELLKQYRNN